MKNKIEGFDWTFGGIADLEPLVLSNDNPLRFKKQCIYVGSHENSDGSAFDVSESLIDHWVKSGNMMLSMGVDIPLPSHHTDDNGATRGKITKMEKGTDHEGRVSLYLSGVANDRSVIEELKQTDISLFSPREAEAGGMMWARPIMHACMTKRPMIKGLEGFQLVLSENGMNTTDDDYYDEEDEEEDDCPKCAKRKKMMAKKKKGKKRMKRQLLSLSDDVDRAAKSLHSQTGENVVVVPSESGTLILAESEFDDSMDASHILTF